MPSNQLVSVIIPTRNSAATIEACLKSIADQTYKPIEIIVVDRDSTDTTKTIAKRYTQHVYNHGPERSAQVNFGVTKATGEYVYKVDSDFILDSKVVEQCVAKAQTGFDAVVVHNSPDPSISWIARIRKFEVDMYKYDLQHSSARFLKKSVYQAIGGFNEAITAGEDYDFQNKLNRAGYKTSFIDAEALHLGEPTKLWPHLVKMYHYGKDSVRYQKANPGEFNGQMSFILLVWLHHWQRFLRHPLKALGLVCYLFLKFTFAGAGLVVGKARG
jgi:glycosyltransferase involved in cell wall biosynthesis